MEQPGSDIKSRLERCDAVASLRAEQEVVAAFQALPDWWVEHGYFFRDPSTDKLRELDVMARRSYRRNPKNLSAPTATIRMLVEVKSLTDYHVVFAPRPSGSKESRVWGYWVGDETQSIAGVSIPDHLIKRGIAPADAFAFAKRFRDIAYPDGESLIGDLVVDSPDVPFVATAFRETNIGGTKELDSSVVWKAIQSLNAAVDGLIASSREGLISDVDLTIDLAREENTDLSAALEREFALLASQFRMFHPVLVLDARLWIIEQGDELREVDSARFAIEEPSQFPHRWVDVVHRKHFESWLARMSSFFSEAFSYPEEEEHRERSATLRDLWHVLFDPDLHIDLTLRRRESRAEKRQMKVRYVDEHGEDSVQDGIE
jgi:hypothetical protein